MWRNRIVHLARLVLVLIPYATMIGTVICLIVSFFFVSPSWLPYGHYAAGFLLIAAVVYCFRGHDSWTERFALATCCLAIHFVFAVIPAISAQEDSRPFVEAVEKASGEDRVFFFNLNADHVGIKYLAEVNNTRRRQVFFICDEDQATEEHYAYRTIDEGFEMLENEIVILRKNQLETLTKYAEAMHKTVVPQFQGKLGHRMYLAVRLVPDENQMTP